MKKSYVRKITSELEGISKEKKENNHAVLFETVTKSRDLIG